MSTHHIQAAFARKRENEHIRTERTEAVDRYYAHWGKQTSKYENWTAPEYYKQAEEKLKKSKEKKEKEEKLNERRDKLRKLLEEEKIMFEEQLRNLERKPSKSRNLNADIMEKIDQNFKAKENEKQRLDKEAMLYGRLRHGVDDGSLLYESKSNNQVLAKLNWLDKQIEDQVQREQEEKITAERTLRMQEEIRKTEENHKKRQEIREKEIREIRALQERHVAELKKRECEAESLKSEAHYLQTSIDHITSELVSLESDKNPFLEDFLCSNNLRNMKMIIRKRSELFRNSLKSDIGLLNRVVRIYSDESSIKRLIGKLNQQLDAEMLNLSQIESMYESEAKLNLQQCEEAWRQMSYERRSDLLNLLRDIRTQLTCKFDENQVRQKDLIDIRATHLSSIENSNRQLKLLIKEDEISPRTLVLDTPRSITDKVLNPAEKVSDSFTNLNLDCLSGDGVEVLSQPNTARSQRLDTPDTTQGPRFGRKKIAWT